MNVLLNGYGKKVRHGALSTLADSNVDAYNTWADEEGNFTTAFIGEIKKLPYIGELPVNELNLQSEVFKKALYKLIDETEKRVSKTVTINVCAVSGQRYCICHTYLKCDKKLGEGVFAWLPKKVTLRIGEEVSRDRGIAMHTVKGGGLEFVTGIYNDPVVVGTELKCYLSLSYNWTE
jgi:hypothetical protein